MCAIASGEKIRSLRDKHYHHTKSNALIDSANSFRTVRLYLLRCQCTDTPPMPRFRTFYIYIYIYTSMATRCCIISLFVFTINNKRTKFDERGKKPRDFIRFFFLHMYRPKIHVRARAYPPHALMKLKLFFFKERSIWPSCC